MGNQNQLVGFGCCDGVLPFHADGCKGTGGADMVVTKYAPHEQIPQVAEVKSELLAAAEKMLEGFEEAYSVDSVWIIGAGYLLRSGYLQLKAAVENLKKGEVTK